MYNMFTPDYANATGLLQHLNSEELKQLLDDDDKLINMVKDLQQVKQIETEREMLIASNKSLAEYNLSLGPELEQNRQELILQYEAAASFKNSIEAMKSRLVRSKCQNETDTMLALLKTATAEAEEATELLVEMLMNGEASVDTFLKDYLKQRTRVHILRTKSDKMASLLDGGNVVATPPEKPRRTKKAPPPPPLPHINANQPPYPVLPGFGAPYPVYKSETNSPILPTRLAPKPPVQIPRRHSNPLQVMSQHPNQSVAGKVLPTNNVQCVSSVTSAYSYAQYVKLPN